MVSLYWDIEIQNANHLISIRNVGIGNWHWNGIQTKIQTIWTKQIVASVKYLRHTKFYQTVSVEHEKRPFFKYEGKKNLSTDLTIYNTTYQINMIGDQQTHWLKHTSVSTCNFSPDRKLALNTKFDRKTVKMKTSHRT